MITNEGWQWRRLGTHAVLFVMGLSSNLQAEAPPLSEMTPEAIGFFTDKVRPLIEEHCTSCHGEVSERTGAPKIRSGFQIISRRGILEGGEHGPAYDAEDPSESHLLDMVSYRDADHEMPPEGRLSDEQIAILTQWVEMGLPWTLEDADFLHEVEEELDFNERARTFWSYVPMADPVPPTVARSEWSQNPIDAFIFSKLTEAGLEPNPPAEPRTLIRRAFYNLTGLPPSPEEVERRAATWTSDSWAALIEELLAQPTYGEKWARHWLDIVRYAESNGFERDSVKNWIWRYRDYVIEAFNQNKPYDRFIFEQIAGDEVADRDAESKIATGFFRLMQWDDEPADPKQHFYDVIDDNLRTTTEGLLGMTMGCARCHDHRGDPISQKEYYQFAAFLNAVTPMSKQGVIEQVDIPEMAAAAEKEREKDAETISDLEDRLAAMRQEATAWALRENPQLAGALELQAEDAEILVPTSAEGESEWSYTFDTPDRRWFEVGFRGDREWKKGSGAFGQGRIRGARRRTEWGTDRIWTRTTFGLQEVPQTAKLHVFHDEDVEIYLNGQLIWQATGYVTQAVEVDLGSQALSAFQTGRNTLAVTCRQTTGGQFLDVGLTANASAFDIDTWIAEGASEQLESDWVRAFQSAKNQLEALRAKKYTEGVLAMTVQEVGTRAPEMRVLIRGNASAPGDLVEPGVPAVFGLPAPEVQANPNGAGTTGRRLALAQWLTHPENPRTSRVMVNRLWQHHFGRGISPSTSDFGFLGMEPTHPELLDWLAQEFIRRDWKIKGMHRLIMSSRAYQMSSAPNPDSSAVDPGNNLFWRFDMRRLTAEELRDSMLAVTGELNPQMGGPSFFPVLQPAVLATSSKGAGMWGASPEDQRNRRSIYITIKRSLKPPTLQDFDFADTDAPCAVRFVTTTPTQALNLLNGPMTNEKALALARRLSDESEGSDAALIRRGMELVTNRPATEWDVQRGLQLLESMRKEHDLSSEEARERFCLLLLNLNEFVYID